MEEQSVVPERCRQIEIGLLGVKRVRDGPLTALGDDGAIDEAQVRSVIHECSQKAYLKWLLLSENPTAEEPRT